jgi:hypothetical protein
MKRAKKRGILAGYFFKTKTSSDRTMIFVARRLKMSRGIEEK